MINLAARRFTSLVNCSAYFSSNASEGAHFLKMVENYFDKAGVHTGIKADLLNYYKRAENVVKCNLTLVRGKSPYK